MNRREMIREIYGGLASELAAQDTEQFLRTIGLDPGTMDTRTFLRWVDAYIEVITQTARLGRGESRTRGT